nr:MAG TPA: hypothetical protein [Caudoviricetes sp.]
MFLSVIGTVHAAQPACLGNTSGDWKRPKSLKV